LAFGRDMEVFLPRIESEALKAASARKVRETATEGAGLPTLHSYPRREAGYTTPYQDVTGQEN